MILFQKSETVPVLYRAGSHRGINLKYPVTPSRKVEWEFDLYLYHDWNPTNRTGKIPVGVADLRWDNAGYGLRKPTSDGFSIRGWFGPNRQIGLYYYHLDQDLEWGDHIVGGSIPTGHTAHVKCMVDLDAGVLGIKVDDEPWSYGSIRVGPNTEVTTVWYDGYFGGKDTAPANMKANVSNVLVTSGGGRALVGTPSLDKIYRAVLREFPTVGSLGIYNRRYIAGTTTWSQHSWRNAWDIAPPEEEKPSNSTSPSQTLDKVAAYLVDMRARGILPVRNVLWRRRNHWDHIHVDADPKMEGVPPLLNQNEEDMKELVIMMQAALKAAGFDPGPVDGIPGPKTEAALTAAYKYGGGKDVATAARLDDLIGKLRGV